MKSHWDWYIAKLGRFIEFGRKHVPSPVLDKQNAKRLARIGFESLQEQLEILEKATGLKLNIPPSVSESLQEMTLVRNLGLHNQWEVDGFYVRQTKNKAWAIGELRTVALSELEEWRGNLGTVIHETAISIAKRYASAPDYHPYK